MQATLSRACVVSRSKPPQHLFPELKLGAEPLKIGPIGVPPRKHEKFTVPGEWYDDEDEREGTEGGGEQEDQDKDEKKVSERSDETCALKERNIYSLQTHDLVYLVFSHQVT